MNQSSFNHCHHIKQTVTPRNFQFLVKTLTPTVHDCVKLVMNSIPLSPKSWNNLHGLSWPPICNPYHYIAFRLKVNQVGKYPTSWRLSKLQLLTVRKPRNLPFPFPSFSFSLLFSLRIVFLFVPFFLSFSFLLFFLSSLFLLISFSIISSLHFLFSLGIFSSFLSIPLIRSKEEISSPFPYAICVVHTFPSLFPYFFISFYDITIMWLIVSHTFKCTTWICQVSLSWGAMWHPLDLAMCHPTPHALKNVKSRLPRNPTKFDVVRFARRSQRRSPFRYPRSRNISIF